MKTVKTLARAMLSVRAARRRVLSGTAGEKPSPGLVGAEAELLRLRDAHGRDVLHAESPYRGAAAGRQGDGLDDWISIRRGSPSCT